jgi:hypothetical protein
VKFGLPAKSSVVAKQIADNKALNKPNPEKPKKPNKAQQTALQKYADSKTPPQVGLQRNLIATFGLPPRTEASAQAGAKGGKGLKHTGLKTVKQIISRTENLIQAANLGNKSTEVRNELDTLLSVLIDRKEVRPQFRTNLMKKLF